MGNRNISRSPFPALQCCLACQLNELVTMLQNQHDISSFNDEPQSPGLRKIYQRVDNGADVTNTSSF